MSPHTAVPFRNEQKNIEKCRSVPREDHASECSYEFASRSVHATAVFYRTMSVSLAFVTRSSIGLFLELSSMRPRPVWYVVFHVYA